jgi:hypothetical protein
VEVGVGIGGFEESTWIGGKQWRDMTEANMMYSLLARLQEEGYDQAVYLP